MEQFTSAATSVSGLIVFLVIALLIGVLTRTKGRGILVTLTASIYIAYALYALNPYASLMPKSPAITAFFTSLALFAALGAAAYFALSRSLSDFGMMGAFSLVVLSLLVAALIMALLYHVFHIESVYQLASPIGSLFTSNELFFWWFIAPLAALLIWRR